MAVAAAWVSRILTISLEMVLPGLLGVWIDRLLGSVVVFTLLGFALGSVLAVWHLLKITASPASRTNDEPDGNGNQG